MVWLVHAYDLSEAEQQKCGGFGGMVAASSPGVGIFKHHFCFISVRRDIVAVSSSVCMYAPRHPGYDPVRPVGVGWFV